MLPLDLHVLGLPPAFNLSHDQTLQFKKRWLNLIHHKDKPNRLIFSLLRCRKSMTQQLTAY